MKCSVLESCNEIAAIDAKVDTIDWRVSQKCDKSLNGVRQCVTNGARPEWEEVSSGSFVLRLLSSQFASLCVEDDILQRKVTIDGKVAKQFIVLLNDKEKVLDWLHGKNFIMVFKSCLLYTSPSPRD